MFSLKYDLKTNNHCVQLFSFPNDLELEKNEVKFIHMN